MLKMMTYQEANAILESSLSPYNYCICKKTALDNGADPNLINSIVPNAEYNRLLPPEAIGAQTITPTTYTIRFLDYDNTVLKTQSLQAGATPTPPSDPTRSGYTFSGWSPTVATVTQNQDYIATYTQNAPSVQYHITFAESKSYAPGFYFYMNNGTFVPISQQSSISANDVAYVAYLGEPVMSNGAPVSTSYLIDTQDSNDNMFYEGHQNYYYQCNSVYHNGDNYTAVRTYMPNSAVVSYCSTRFNGDGQVPSTSVLLNLLNSITQLNTALQFIGAEQLKTNNWSDIGSDSSDWYYKMTNRYWSCNADYEEEDGAYVYGMKWVGGYSQYENSDWVSKSYTEMASSSITAKVRAIKPIDTSAPVVANNIYYEYDVPASTIPECPQEYTPQDTETEAFAGWNPTLYAADKDQIYTAKWRPIPSGGDDPSNPYSIYCEGVPSGGTIQVDVHQTSVGISWYGPDPADQNWDVTGSGSGGSAQAGYHSWGDGYVNNLDFTSTTTIQSGGFISYTVTGIHPVEGGSTSISGYWNVEVVESH